MPRSGPVYPSLIIPVSTRKCNRWFGLFHLFPQQFAHCVPGQGFRAEFHRRHPLIERQGAVGVGDEIPDGLLLVFLAVDNGADLLALFPDDAFLDGLALGQQIFQFFGADVLTVVEDDDIFFLRPVM